MTIKDLIASRAEKHKSYNNSTYPLAEKSEERKDSLSSLIADESVNWIDSLSPDALDKHVIVQGRILTIRRSGKLSFLTINDHSGNLQIVASKKDFPEYDETLKALDAGDLIEVRGQPCLTKSGEKSLLVENMALLSKCLLPPPEKWEGLQDQEIKYRQRYMHLFSDQDARNTFMLQSYLFQAIHCFLQQNGFLEVSTPTLSATASGANARPFETHHHALDQQQFLRIAPELHLKRLIVGGMPKVYELGKVFRNEGLSTRHNPEFNLLEFYQAYGTFDDLLVYGEDILKFVDEYLSSNVNVPKNLQEHYLQLKNNRSFSLDSMVRVDMKGAVFVACYKHGINTDHNVSFLTPIDPNNERFKKLDWDQFIQELNDLPSSGEKLYHCFEVLAEPYLAEDYRTVDKSKSIPVFITSYPKEVSPLARSKDRFPHLTDRYELFIEGMEVANAFQELNDPSEQRKRFEEQQASKSEEKMSIDEDYLIALQYGMPPTIGYGMGIDRLCQLLFNQPSIKDVILFPAMKKAHSLNRKDLDQK